MTISEALQSVGAGYACPIWLLRIRVGASEKMNGA